MDHPGSLLWCQESQAEVPAALALGAQVSEHILLHHFPPLVAQGCDQSLITNLSALGLSFLHILSIIFMLLCCYR